MISVGQALSVLISKVVFWFLVGHLLFTFSAQQNSDGFSIFSMVTVMRAVMFYLGRNIC